MLCLSGRVEIQVGSTTLSPEDGFLGVILIAGNMSTSMDPLDGFLTVEQSGSLPSDPIYPLNRRNDHHRCDFPRDQA